jgi:hypothetical protein
MLDFIPLKMAPAFLCAQFARPKKRICCLRYFLLWGQRTTWCDATLHVLGQWFLLVDRAFLVPSQEVVKGARGLVTSQATLVDQNDQSSDWDDDD